MTETIEKRGRPRGEPTAVTTVMLSSSMIKDRSGFEYKNADFVDKIELWLSEVDIDEMVKNAAIASDRHFKDTGLYRPVSFKVFSDIFFDERRTIRLKTETLKRLERVAKRLGTSKTEIIRICLCDDFRENGGYLGRVDGKILYQPAVHKPRKNSSEARRRDGVLKSE